MSRIYLLSAVSALALSSSAFAADIYRHEGGSLKDAPVHSVATWSGFYVGGHVGGLGGRDSENVKVEQDGDAFDDELDGVVDDNAEDNQITPGDSKDGEFLFKDLDDDITLIGGVHAGYNFQRYGSPLVLGIEGDLSFGDDIDYLASVRARLGFATEASLFYITGGVAFAGFEDEDFVSLDLSGDKAETDIALLDEDDDDDSSVGFVVGAGAEFKIRHNVSLGVEGLYYVFDRDDKSITYTDLDDGKPGDTVKFSQEQDDDFWVVRARLSYHFHREHHTPLK